MTQNEAVKVLQTKSDALVTMCRTLERLAEEFLGDTDEYIALISTHTCCERERFDPIETFGYMRNILRTCLAVKDTLQKFSGTWSTNFDHFDEKIKESQRHIDSSVMHCGLKRLPDELLSDILEHAVVFVQVLSSRCASDKILAIAERSGFQSLTAYIEDKSLTESIKTILGLRGHLEKLRILYLTGSIAEAIEHHAGDLSFPFLRSMLIHNKDQDYNPRSRFPGPCYAPRLERLRVGFIPHPSLAGSLTRCSLYPPSVYFLRDLFEFLSSTIILQRLTISICAPFADQENAHLLDPISLQHLVYLCTCGINGTSVASARTFTENISADAVEKLELHLAKDVDIGAYFTCIQTKVSIRELQLELLHFPVVNLGRILNLLPDHVEVLALVHIHEEIIFAPAYHEAVRARRLRAIRFQYLGWHWTRRTGILYLRDLLMAAARDTICIEFLGCVGVKDGTYALSDVESAFGSE